MRWWESPFDFTLIEWVSLALSAWQMLSSWICVMCRLVSLSIVVPMPDDSGCDEGVCHEVREKNESADGRNRVVILVSLAIIERPERVLPSSANLL